MALKKPKRAGKKKRKRMNAQKLNRSTTLSIIYIACCVVVLMQHNVFTAAK